VLCVAYLVGLLLSGVAGAFQVGTVSISTAGLILAPLIIIGGAIAPKSYRLGLRFPQWCWVALVCWLATAYISVRSPIPPPNDISESVERVQAIAPTHIVSGWVGEEPGLNRALKGRFMLSVKRLRVEDDEGHVTFEVPTRGQLYVTAPLPQVTGLHSGQWVTARGRVYSPQTALNPNGFDFQAYLAQRQSFAGFVAADLQFSEHAQGGLWQIRRRIVRTQVRALGSPLGQLVSAMALGRRAVDLPFDVRDLFSRVGLAHTIAASGFHVSLLLGTVLSIVRSRSGKVQFIVGISVLAGYITLTGWQLSVMRAALMGVAALIGLVLERAVKPSGALLVAVTGLLLINPTWIWDIGFQLSVAATFGLIVMVPAITRWLNWLPITLASLVAVPIAATLWTVPLSLYHFNVISAVSIALNVVATPLVTVLSLGGMVSGAIALLIPAVGGFVASFLYYPARLLVILAEVSSQLPGSSLAIGQISIGQLVGLYGGLFLSLWPGHLVRLQRLWPVGFLGILLVPLGWQLLTQNQVTVLAANGELIWVGQHHGQTTLVNSGTEQTAFYTVNSFLKQAGVNHLEQAIALPFDREYPAGWQFLLHQMPSRALYGTTEETPLAEYAEHYRPLTIGQSSTLKALTVQPLGTENPILRLTTSPQSWLLLPDLPLNLQTYLAGAGSVLQSDVLVWSGEELSETLLAVVQPRTAIAYGRTLPEFVERSLQQNGVQVFWTARDGAVTWRDRDGFHGYLERKRRNALPWG